MVSLVLTVSNSNDALEKTRLLSLTDASLLLTAPILNVTVLADPAGGRIVIRGTHSHLLFPRLSG